MRIDTGRVHLPLGPHGHAQLRRARNVRMTGIEGVTWITVDGQSADVILGPGESFVVPNDEIVVAVAMQGRSMIEIEGGSGTVRSSSTLARVASRARSGRPYPGNS